MEKKNIDAYNLCSKCGNFSHINEKHDFCIICGEKLMDKCPMCKELILFPTAIFCHKCGTRLIYKNQSES